MTSFTTYRFDELYEMSSGISTTPEQAGHGTPFVSFSTIFNNPFLPETLPDLMDVSEQEKVTYSVKKGDVFLTRTSENLDELAMSSVALKDYPETTFSGFAKRLRPLESTKVYDKYMGFFLRSEYFRKIINNNAIMTLRASFNENIFSYIKFDLPEYDTQVKIGDLLYELETKKNLNSKINDEILKVVRMIFNYWFIQFDFPKQDGKPYKSSGGKLVYNSALNKEIPEGWEVKELKDLVDISTESVNPSENPNEAFNYFSIPSYDKFNFYESTLGKEIKSSKYKVDVLDILVSKLNPKFNRVIFAPNNLNMISSTEFVIWRAKNSTLKNYLYLIATDKSFQEYCINSAVGTSNSHKRVNPKIMMQYKVPYNENIVRDFGETLGTLLDTYILNLEEKNYLEGLQKWLTPLLINGQITLK